MAIHGPKLFAFAISTAIALSVQPAEAFLGTNEVASAVCRKLSTCHQDLSFETCKAGFLERTDVDTEVGFPKGTFKNYGEAINAELNRKVRFFVYEFDACLDIMTGLSCTDPLVANAYQPTAEDKLGRVSEMFSMICSDMFWYQARFQKK
ncbi:MAG: hypothetical protein V4692_08210 [Bdellovibrionota bacterium]